MNNLESKLKEGDIIFTSIPHFLYKAVEKGTNSPTSHVGIIIKENGQWLVAESKIPTSKLSPLKSFIDRSDNCWVSVKRYKDGLTPSQLENIKTACDKRMGKLYDIGFNYHSKKLFCSKFVHDVFLESCELSIGEVETYHQLLQKNPDVSTLFWRFWFCGLIPFKTHTITPHSQYIDNQLLEVNLHD